MTKEKNGMNRYRTPVDFPSITLALATNDTDLNWAEKERKVTEKMIVFFSASAKNCCNGGETKDVETDSVSLPTTIKSTATKIEGGFKKL